MPSPVQRLVYRYRRWQYHREMALPTPTTARDASRTHRIRRKLTKVTHPRRTLVTAYDRHVERRPAPTRSEAELHGGRLRRTYVRTRIKLSDFVHGFPEMPVVFQILVCSVLGLALAGGGYAVYRATKSKPSKSNLAAFATDPQTFYADAYSATPAHVPRVLVAGDVSQTFATGLVNNDFTGGGIHAVGLLSGGCGISDGDIMIGRQRLRRADRCHTWAARFADAVKEFKPNVSVLMTGTGEEYDQLVNGRRLKAGTPEWRAYLTKQLDVARTALTGSGAKMVLLNLPCGQPPSGNQLRAQVNGLWRSYALAHTGDVVLGDLDLVMCPGGHIKSLSHKPMLDKNDNINQVGNYVFWNWISTVAKHVAKAV